MAYIPGYVSSDGSMGGTGWNDKAAYDRYTSGQGQFKLAKGINPNTPGWGDYMDPDWRLIGFGGDVGGRTENKHGTQIKPDTSFAVLERIGYQPPQQAAATSPAPAPPAAPELSPESLAYRKEADAKLAEAQGILDQFKIEQNKADEARKLQEKLAIQSQATAASNLARSQMAPNLQIQPASGTPQTAGTQGFKRRQPIQTLNKTGGLASLNIQTPSTLNI